MPKLFPDNLSVVALAYDGLCTFEFSIAVEVFGLRRPEMGDNWYQFAVASVDPGELRASGGIRVLVDGGLELLEQAGTIIIPGWTHIDRPAPDNLILALQAAHVRGARILSICSGAFVLAQAGLLRGGRATTHWRYSEMLAARYPDISVVADVLYIDNGQVLTAAGSAAGIDLCLHLVRRDFGAAKANMVARRLVIQPHRDGGQAQFVERAVPSQYESARLGPLLDRLRRELPAEAPIAALAQSVGMSTRTFLHRFKDATGTTPARWLMAERLSKARGLLEESSLTIMRIAEVSGFGSTTNFRLYFRRQFATTPVQYRARFGQSE
ncbi:MAG: transcriptional regulator FtrA [Rouxiella aceris]|uniref:transcriptional regulator FtrA n=1 Tax=Rouxiella aceris TaxID=2703884 RepID=UPI002844A0F9|nr:transcriptional regulator FtrA [Rouxiella aceris]MDR3434882.1 transcriptional regulator FtrA [Rouxiella aceris]